MSLWMIAWRSIQQRGLASALTAFSMALGVMLVVAVLSIHGVIEQSFQTNASLGYDMIVGAKGGKLQLTLNSVYYLSQPIENIPYDYYLEFYPQDRREQELKNSLAWHSHEAIRETLELHAVTAGGPAAGADLLAGALALDAADSLDAERVGHERAGQYGMFTAFAVPLCLGDYFGPYRVVGTTPDMFEQLRHGPDKSKQYEFSQGRNFRTWSEENGYFEAVCGAEVARNKKVKVGEKVSVAHGDPEGHGHDRRFTVVGILDRTGTPNDRAMFVNIEGFFLMEDHAKPVEQRPEGLAEQVLEFIVAADGLEEEEELELLPVEQREVTAILVRTTHQLVTPGLENSINEGDKAQAVLPVREIYNLFETFVRPIQRVFLLLAVIICFVSGISILVSIYNSMSDRRRDIAVMRALGAGRGTVMAVILIESFLLSAGGGLAGWMAAHALNVVASVFYIEQAAGVSVGFFDFSPGVDVIDWLKWPPRVALTVGISGYLIAMVGAIPAFRRGAAHGLASIICPLYVPVFAAMRPREAMGWLGWWVCGALVVTVSALGFLAYHTEMTPELFAQRCKITAYVLMTVGGAVALFGYAAVCFAAFRRGAASGVLSLLPFIWPIYVYLHWHQVSRWAQWLFIGLLAMLAAWGVWELSAGLISLEILMIGGILVFAVLVGLVPAISAYFTDVAVSLGK